MEEYRTKQGDMWDTIAQSQLGSTYYTAALMAVNQRYLTYVRFPAGVLLYLPEITESIEAQEDLPPWKQDEEDIEDE